MLGVDFVKDVGCVGCFGWWGAGYIFAVIVGAEGDGFSGWHVRETEETA